MQYTKVENLKILKEEIYKKHTIQRFISKREWKQAIKISIEDVFWIELSQLDGIEARDQEYYFLLIMPKQVYTIHAYIVKNEIFSGKFDNTAYFKNYDRVYIEKIINNASLLMTNLKFEME